MGKYEPLTRFLEAQNSGEVPMSFAQIERLLGRELPPSKRRREWWSNNAANNVMTRAWLAAGYRSERVDVAGERLVFRREGGGAKQVGEDRVDKARRLLAGMVTLPPGLDLTEPVDEAWEAAAV